MDYTEEQKLKFKEIEEHERKLREESARERNTYLSKGNRHERRKLKAMGKLQ